MRPNRAGLDRPGLGHPGLDRPWLGLRLLLPALLLTVAGCSVTTVSGSGSVTGSLSGSPTGSASGSAQPIETSTPPTTPPITSTPPATSTTPPPPPPGTAQRLLATLTLSQRVGQLLMVDCPSTAVSTAALTAIRDQQVGSIILDGNSTLSVVQTATLTAQLQQTAAPGLGLLIATDQEGGLVRRMRGPGFTAMPSALDQGRVDPAALRQQAQTWGTQLKAAGINIDLAPVLDTVPPGITVNPPIGDLDRQYGSDPATVAAHGLAVAAGLRDAGVAATVKHFPGLGRVAGNTDTTAGVADTVTTADDPLLAPFAEAVRQGVGAVMMSTAIYTRIDPDRPAAFSARIVTGLLRTTLGFTGVVISDDLGAAKQVSGYPLGARAVDFVAAGGDIVLTVVPGQAAVLAAALVARAQADPAFAALVDAAALRVLTLKQSLGLLG